jgi:hypothetical protein
MLGKARVGRFDFPGSRKGKKGVLSVLLQTLDVAHWLVQAQLDPHSVFHFLMEIL